jgi:hypothetical protein
VIAITRWLRQRLCLFMAAMLGHSDFVLFSRGPPTPQYWGVRIGVAELLVTELLVAVRSEGDDPLPVVGRAGGLAGFASAIWFVKWVARDLDRHPGPGPDW